MKNTLHIMFTVSEDEQHLLATLGRCALASLALCGDATSTDRGVFRRDGGRSIEILKMIEVELTGSRVEPERARRLEASLRNTLRAAGVAGPDRVKVFVPETIEPAA
ncbi:MAG: hypothetical protein ABIO72_02370 [Patescibacteria group bacterium]